MPSIKVNFSDVSSGFEAVPAGRYPTKVTGWEEKESGERAKNPGAAYISWEFTVQDPHELAGRKLWMNTSLLPQALFGLKGLLKATELFDDDALAADDFDFDPEEVIGADVCLKVTQRVYDEELVNDVKKVLPISKWSDESTDDSILP